MKICSHSLTVLGFFYWGTVNTREDILKNVPTMKVNGVQCHWSHWHSKYLVLLVFNV